LWKHSSQIEQTLFTRITDLFGFSRGMIISGVWIEKKAV
jgi:hypothetical protein